MRVKDALGRWGEQVGADHLVAAGFEIIERNWRGERGELDIVARDGATVVFCEVKTRSGLGYGAPAEAVTRVKVRRLQVLATQWLAEHPTRGRRDVRFDVVEVLRHRRLPLRVVHLRGAF